jgi:hypothetical protein
MMANSLSMRVLAEAARRIEREAAESRWRFAQQAATAQPGEPPPNNIEVEWLPVEAEIAY